MKKFTRGIIIGLMIFIGFFLIVIDSAYSLKCELLFNAVEIIVESLVVVAGFWVTIYLLIVELYKDRYPLKYVEDKYLCFLKNVFINILLCALYGLAVMIRKDYILESAFFLLVSLFTIFRVGHYIYDASRTLMTSNYIQNYCADISARFKENDCNIEFSSKHDLERFFDECIVKEEFCAAQSLADCTGDLICDYVKKYVDFYDAGKDRKQINENFEEIVGLCCQQLERCMKVDSSILRDDILLRQIMNIRYCIDVSQYEFFKLYIDNLMDLTSLSQQKKNDNLVESIFQIFGVVVKYLFEKDKNDWAIYIFDKAYAVTNANSYFYSDEYLKEYYSLLTIGLKNCSDDDSCNHLLENLKNTTNRTCLLEGDFSSLIEYYALIFNEITEKKTKYLKDFVELFLGEDSISSKDVKLIEFKFHCIKVIKENKEFQDKAKAYILALLRKVIEMKENYRGFYFLPDYEKEIDYTGFSELQVNNICSDFQDLFVQTIMNDNLMLFYIILGKLEDCILASKYGQDNVQKGLFYQYILLIAQTKSLRDKQYLETVFFSLEEVVKKLDKEKNISEEFGNYIITQIEGAASRVESKNDEVIIQALNLFDDLMNEENGCFFCTNWEKKKIIVRSIYKIGISCIEFDFEDGLRKASNSLGWMTVSAIKQGVVSFATYLIKLESMMLNISKKMDVSIKTETFMVTYFTTVGMFCYSNSKYDQYLNLIFMSIIDENPLVIETAIDIRTYENDMWDDLLNGNTEEYVRLFIEDLNKAYASYVSNNDELVEKS